jgi:hypothetical protein
VRPRFTTASFETGDRQHTGAPAFPELVAALRYRNVIRAHIQNGRERKRASARAASGKGNPGEGDDAGVQKQAIADGGSYPAALLTRTARGD